MEQRQEQEQQQQQKQFTALVNEYVDDCNNNCTPDDLFKNNITEFLRNNDCRAILSSAVDGDVFAEMFAFTTLLCHLDLVQTCVENGMNVDIKDKNNTSALIYASSSNYIKIVSYLLEQHANIDVQNNDGYTALMYASQYVFTEIVQLLLNHNANIDLKNKDGKTALDLCQSNDIKEMLLNHVTMSSYVLK